VHHVQSIHEASTEVRIKSSVSQCSFPYFGNCTVNVDKLHFLALSEGVKQSVQDHCPKLQSVSLGRISLSIACLDGELLKHFRAIVQRNRRVHKFRAPSRCGV
jgi:hypothetical protein